MSIHFPIPVSHQCHPDNCPDIYGMYIEELFPLHYKLHKALPHPGLLPEESHHPQQSSHLQLPDQKESADHLHFQQRNRFLLLLLSLLFLLPVHLQIPRMIQPLQKPEPHLSSIVSIICFSYNITFLFSVFHLACSKYIIGIHSFLTHGMNCKYSA